MAGLPVHPDVDGASGPLLTPGGGWPIQLQIVADGGNLPQPPTAPGDYCLAALASGDLEWSTSQRGEPALPESDPATSGQAVGYAFFSPHPRAQTVDISVLLHRTAIPVMDHGHSPGRAIPVARAS